MPVEGCGWMDSIIILDGCAAACLSFDNLYFGSSALCLLKIMQRLHMISA